MNRAVRRSAALRLAPLLGVIALGAACRTLPPAFDFNEPGWTVRHGQAVWQPAGAGGAIAGELLVATHPDGRAFAQFSKPPLAVVTARAGQGRWQVRDAGGTNSGRGAPPAHVVWFQLARLSRGGPVAAPWSAERRGEAAWRLHDATRAESLEGFLAP
jgi:hypothetical protein